MTGLLIIPLLVLGAVAILYAVGVRGGLLQMIAAALLFGAAGYAVQGRPQLPGSPRSKVQAQAPIPLTTLRHAFFGRFTSSERWFLISESLARRGRSADAVGIMQSAVRQYPRDPALWVGLGNALVDHSYGLTPASQLAYERAIQLTPDHPAPKFFYGLALARSGDGSGANALWRSVLADAPADASWRPLVEGAASAISSAGAATPRGPSSPEAGRSPSMRQPSTGQDRTARQPPR